MQELGVLPADSLLAELMSARAEFTELRRGAIDLAQSFGVSPVPTPEDLQALTDLQPLLRAIADVEGRKQDAERNRDQALAVLRSVLAIVHREKPAFEPLTQTQADARALLQTISEAPWSRLPAETGALTAGQHPFSELLVLIGGDEGLDDEQWAVLLRSVGQNFDRGLALAAARDG